jgi:HSP20 family protein
MARGDLDRMISELWGGGMRSGARDDAALAPVDVYLTDEPPTLTVELAVPGVDPGTLDIGLEGGALVIRGERRRTGAERRMYHHAEIPWGPFERRLQLNVPVDAAAARASCDRGLLVIALPLAPRSGPRRVEIALGRGDGA